MEKPWVFETPLDLVHSRICSGSAIRNWPQYLSEAFRCLKPGGWVEAQEFDVIPKSDDNSFPPNSFILQYHILEQEGMLKSGCNLASNSKELKRLMEEAGFVNVQAIDFKLPLSPWCKEPKLKEAGAFAMVSMLEGMSGMSMAVFTRNLGWEPIEVEVLLANVRNEWKQKGIHAYYDL